VDDTKRRTSTGGGACSGEPCGDAGVIDVVRRVNLSTKRSSARKLSFSSGVMRLTRFASRCGRARCRGSRSIALGAMRPPLRKKPEKGSKL
jgi:hypothetical protein